MESSLKHIQLSVPWDGKYRLRYVMLLPRSTNYCCGLRSVLWLYVERCEVTVFDLYKWQPQLHLCWPNVELWLCRRWACRNKWAVRYKLSLRWPTPRPNTVCHTLMLLMLLIRLCRQLRTRPLTSPLMILLLIWPCRRTHRFISRWTTARCWIPHLRLIQLPSSLEMQVFLSKRCRFVRNVM